MRRPTLDSSRRYAAVTRSIQSALLDPRTFHKTAIGRVLAFFCFFYIRLIRYQADLFRHLRNQIWGIGEVEYEACFRPGSKKTLPLQSMGDLGFSGSVRAPLDLRTGSLLIRKTTG
jgi:hypothetical protein